MRRRSADRRTDDREQVAAVAAEVRRDDTQREVRGDDRVDRVAAVGEHAETDRAREVVRGRHCAAANRFPSIFIGLLQRNLPAGGMCTPHVSCRYESTLPVAAAYRSKAAGSFATEAGSWYSALKNALTT